MKIERGYLYTILLTFLWIISGVVSTERLKNLERSGLIPYGPLPSHISKNYSYEGLQDAFDRKVPLSRASEYSKVEFENLILNTLSSKEQKEFRPYISRLLDLSVEYQVDPFWITSIVMVESNFNTTALSPKNARGLMQIKPDTAQHLYQLMQKNISDDEISSNLYHPEKNIEVGIFYLKKLLHNFRMNYHFATVAYNIGPSKLRTRLEENSLDVSNFSYLVKVVDRYSQLSEKYSLATKLKPKPFELTYVYLNQGLKFEEKVSLILNQVSSENLMANF
jgi:soluble lytic murein transglycosylase-like protein